VAVVLGSLVSLLARIVGGGSWQSYVGFGGSGLALLVLLLWWESRRRRAPRVEVSVLPPDHPYQPLYERKYLRQRRGQGGNGSTG
jgi:hypothetical protein